MPSKMNKRKGKIMKDIWFNSESQYQKLISSIEQNDDTVIAQILKDIYFSGGFN